MFPMTQHSPQRQGKKNIQDCQTKETGGVDEVRGLEEFFSRMLVWYKPITGPKASHGLPGWQCAKADI